jgi:hypothetical protein
MSFNVLNRKVHYWAAFVAAGPLLVMIASGLLLQTKKHWAWVQPVEHRGTGEAPSIDLEGILASLKTVPEMKVESWADVNRLDVRPGRGVVKAWLMNGYEIGDPPGKSARMRPRTTCVSLVTYRYWPGPNAQFETRPGIGAKPMCSPFGENT